MSIGDGHLDEHAEQMRQRQEISKNTSRRMKAPKKSSRPDRSLAKYDKISSLGQEIALIPGGMKQFMSWVRSASNWNKSLETLVDVFGQLPESQQNAIALEETCKTLGIYVGEVFKEAVGVAYERKMNVAKLVASLAMPAVVAKNIKEAKKPEGVEDRKIFFQATGITPTPKGSTINIAQMAGASSMTTDGQPSGVPSFEDSVVTFSEVIRNAVESAPMLPEPSEPVEGIEPD